MLAKGGTDELLFASKLLGDFLLAALLCREGLFVDEIGNFCIFKEYDEQAVAAGYLLEEGQLATQGHQSHEVGEEH